MDLQGTQQDPVKALIEPVKPCCICIISHYSPLTEEVGDTILWLLPECTVFIGRDDVTKVKDMACSTVQVGLTHFTVGCKAAQGQVCSCFVLLDNVGEGVCIARSRALVCGQYDYLKHGEYFVLGKSSAFIVTVISNRVVLAELRKSLRSDVQVLRAKYGMDVQQK
ncbi:hypothetical protein BOX15_Mlig003345g3 [Macrostomum lignano]|uniref:Uncharacterized protein n=1 Tax=Macrostomum lignano TaxID=282301 RepID=A0A267G3K8_9PLAT|nr:hypothetical protein BOX15_Mlig003345g1 [Macrostomum lignano]PAA61690.1 hypothetical protein BOX15_Mlig031906g1 [Macrostomum lignano]PAA79879.1 hypothetical protein BOX15_Mlig003345g3 [Macrostomum lignano]